MSRAHRDKLDRPSRGKPVLESSWVGEGRVASEMPSGFTSLFQLMLSAFWFPVNKVSVKHSFPLPEYIYIYIYNCLPQTHHMLPLPHPRRTVLTTNSSIHIHECMFIAGKMLDIIKSIIKYRHIYIIILCNMIS